MNLERLEKVVEYLRAHPEDGTLLMDWWRRKADTIASCGTAGCLAWHVVIALVPEEELPKFDLGSIDGYEFANHAEELLELDSREREALFWAEQWPHGFDYIEKAEGAGEDSELTRRNKNMATLIALLEQVLERGGVWWMRR